MLENAFLGKLKNKNGENYSEFWLIERERERLTRWIFYASWVWVFYIPFASAAGSWLIREHKTDRSCRRDPRPPSLVREKPSRLNDPRRGRSATSGQGTANIKPFIYLLTQIDKFPWNTTHKLEKLLFERKSNARRHSAACVGAHGNKQ